MTSTFWLFNIVELMGQLNLQLRVNILHAVVDHTHRTYAASAINLAHSLIDVGM